MGIYSWNSALLLRGLFYDPSCPHGFCPRSLWATMERIRSVGFPVYDFGHIGVMYGDHDRGESHSYIQRRR